MDAAFPEHPRGRRRQARGPARQIAGELEGRRGRPADRGALERSPVDPETGVEPTPCHRHRWRHPIISVVRPWVPCRRGPDLAERRRLAEADRPWHVISEHGPQPGRPPPRPARRATPAGGASGALHPRRDRDRMLRSGFTTVRDVGSYDDESSVLKAGDRDGDRAGRGSGTCGRIVSATLARGARSSARCTEADGPWEMRKAVREQVRRGADFIKFMATGARSSWSRIQAGQMTLEEMAAIVDEAPSHGAARSVTPRGWRARGSRSRPARTRRARALAPPRAAAARQDGREGHGPRARCRGSTDLAERFVDDSRRRSRRPGRACSTEAIAPSRSPGGRRDDGARLRQRASGTSTGASAAHRAERSRDRGAAVHRWAVRCPGSR